MNVTFGSFAANHPINKALTKTLPIFNVHFANFDTQSSDTVFTDYIQISKYICIYIWGIYVEEAIEQRTNNNNNRHTHTHTPPFEKALISMHDLKCVQERGINYKLYK